MKANKGLIGASQTYSATDSSMGVTEIFDQYINRGSSTWPLTIYYLSLSSNSGTINENTSTTFTFTTSGVSANITLYWTISHGTTVNTDFYSSTVSGSFTQSASSNTGTFSVITAFTGNTSKSSTTFSIQIRTGSTSGPVVYTSGTFTIPAVTVTHNWSVTPVNEGSSTVAQISFSNVGSYSYYMFYLNAIGGTATNGTDYSTLTLATSYYLLPSSTSQYQTVTITADANTEGTETLTLTLQYTNQASVMYTYLSTTLSITDSSTTPTVTITPSTTSVTEGSSVTFTIGVSGSYTGTLTYQINQVSGSITTGDFTDGLLTGSVSITSGSGSIVKTLTSDGVTEGTEQFTLSIKNNVGTTLATSSTISVSDSGAALPYKQGFLYLGSTSVATTGVVVSYVTIDSAGNHSSDTAGSGTARLFPVGSGYGNQYGFAIGGLSSVGAYLSTLTYINNNGTIGSGTTAGYTCYGESAGRYGGDKALVYGGFYSTVYGYATYNYYYQAYMTVSNTGTFGSITNATTTGVRYATSNVTYGTGASTASILLGGGQTVALNYYITLSSAGALAGSFTYTGANRWLAAGASYGAGSALIWSGANASVLNTFKNITNTGTIGADTTYSAAYANRQASTSCTVGGSNIAVFLSGYTGASYLTTKFLTYANGVFSGDISTTNSVRYGGAGAQYGQ